MTVIKDVKSIRGEEQKPSYFEAQAYAVIWFLTGAVGCFFVLQLYAAQ